MYNFLSEKDEFPHLNKKMISIENLISAIEDLDSNGIISFEEFKELKYTEIKKQYFLMPNSTQVTKAIIKIEDKRAGKKGFSEYTEIIGHYMNGQIVSEKTITTYF